MEFGSYGVSAQGGTGSALLEELTFSGVVVAPAVLPSATVADLNARLDGVYGTQCAEVGGEQFLSKINDLDIARCPLAYDPAFTEVAAHPLIRQVATEALGENVVLVMQNGIINRPDRPQFQMNWHRDLNYQHWTSSKPLAISVLVTLEDFNETTGGTVFLPGSHKFESFPSQGLVERQAVAPEAPAGSFIFFDSMTFHRAGRNRSSRVRRALNHVIGVPILAQQVDIPAMLNASRPSDDWLAGYLGYRWNPVPDVAQWRLRKVAPDVRQAPGSADQSIATS